MIAVSGTLKDVFGVGVGGTLVFQLCGFGAAVPRVVGTSLIAKTGQVEIQADPITGVFSTNVYGNDVIVPANTYYTVTVKDDNGDVVQISAYQFTGGAAVDLSNVAPYVIP